MKIFTAKLFFFSLGLLGHGMPNATLCGKAVVELLLAQHDQGVTITDVQNQLVANGDLPRAYLVSKERMEKCKDLDEVWVQERKGYEGVGTKSLDGLIKAQQQRNGGKL